MDNPCEKFFTLTNNLFTFESYSCDCVTDIENIRPGEVKKTIKMQGLPSSTIRFAFAPDRGMVRLAKNGAIDSDRILTELLSLPEGDTERLFVFFREYGFFSRFAQMAMKRSILGYCMSSSTALKLLSAL